ncbi:hypothetical protein KAR91_84240 [Candidatus Pacearchaeota archaeon]|nr:hypothetical protein [Candidatus Pacearchaeota archaeon]
MSNTSTSKKTLSLADAQSNRKKELSSTGSLATFTAIADILLEQHLAGKNEGMDTTEIGQMLGIPKSDGRHAMQKGGKLSADQLPTVEHPTNGQYWVHLSKSSGRGKNRNVYSVTKSGDLPKV